MANALLLGLLGLLRLPAEMLHGKSFVGFRVDLDLVEELLSFLVNLFLQLVALHSALRSLAVLFKLPVVQDLLFDYFLVHFSAKLRPLGQI